MKLLFKKTLGALRPAALDAEEAMHKIANGSLVMVEIKRGRNLAHHRLFFALLHLVHTNQDRYDTFEGFRTAFLIGLGWCDTVVCKDGKVGYMARSISFANMDQATFDRLFNDAVNLVCQRWLPTVKDEELRREIEEMVAA
ncbi:MAG: DUF1367 family protein [Candidatus Brocadiales bacterium]|nr:DUF1367 family protein [Candidatus Bathyanammoxibius sp.]